MNDFKNVYNLMLGLLMRDDSSLSSLKMHPTYAIAIAFNLLHLAAAVAADAASSPPTGLEPSTKDAGLNHTLDMTYEIRIPGHYRALNLAIIPGRRRLNQGTAASVHSQLVELAAAIRAVAAIRSAFAFHGAKVQIAVNIDIEFFNLPPRVTHPMTNAEAMLVIDAVLAHFRTNDLSWIVSEGGASVAAGKIRLMRFENPHPLIDGRDRA